VARQLGIKSYNTLKYWIIYGLPSVKNKNRKNKRERKNKLTEQQQQFIFGYMLFLQSQYLPITRNKIHYFITTQISRSISKKWVSRFLKKKHWTRKTTTRRDPYQLSDEYVNNCLEFIKEV
jgi:transposase